PRVGGDELQRPAVRVGEGWLPQRAVEIEDPLPAIARGNARGDRGVSAGAHEARVRLARALPEEARALAARSLEHRARHEASILERALVEPAGLAEAQG